MNVTCKQTKFPLDNKIILFYSILFYSILFYIITTILIKLFHNSQLRNNVRQIFFLCFLMAMFNQTCIITMNSTIS